MNLKFQNIPLTERQGRVTLRQIMIAANQKSVKSSKWKNKSIKQFSVKYFQFPENGRIKTQTTYRNYHRIE